MCSQAVAGTTLPRLKLSPDPIHSHYFHLNNANNGAAYLLMCTWLKRVLQQVSEVAAYASSSPSSSPSFSPSGMDTRTQEALDSIERGYLGVEGCDPISVCKLLSPISVGNGGAIDRHCGACVISDAMLGHLAIHRGSMVT